MADDNSLLNAAGRIADGDIIDWASISSTLPSEEDRLLADELAVVAHIAAGHRQLHQLLPVDPDTPANLVPDRARWGHLDLLNIVGRGSYGMVYRAWDTRLERLVALKLFHGAANPDAVIQEGRMLARMRHENVVSVYGADVIDGVAGIWMELVHGRRLDQIVKSDGPLGAREAAAVGADIAMALATVHAAGLLHCDVKAQNVVRESGGRVVLMDLGAGRVAPEHADSDQLSDVAGTPRYMAPELFQFGVTATKASDIYSFGVLLYYMVSGGFPVDGKTLGALKRAHAAGESRALGEVCPNLPAALVDLVSKAIARDASVRPESAAEMQSRLAAVAREPDPAPRPSRTGWWVLAAAAAVVVAVLLLRPMLTPSAPAAPAVRSIAVLPIKNLTGDEAKAYVADGLTEVLISNLARVRSLRVPSFASVVPFRNSEAAPGEIASTLGVQLLLAGSVTQVDSRIRIAVQLIDPVSGNAIWGEELAREPAGMLSAQSEIVRMVASRLTLQLSAEETHRLADRTVDAKAQDLYLKGLALTVSTPTDDRQAASFFRQAVEIDPGFAESWAELAFIELRLIESSVSVDRRVRANFARELAEKSLAIDPELATGYAALGSVQFYHDWNFQAAEKTLRRAVEVNPSHGFARHWLAMFLAARGQLAEAIRFGLDSQAVEPRLPIHTVSLGMLYYYARDYRNALIQTERSSRLASGFALADFGFGRIFSAQGRHDEAIAALEKAVAADRNSGWLVELARAYSAAGRRDDSARVLAELTDRQRAGESFSLDNLAYIAAAEGRVDDAFAILNQAVDQRLVNVLWIAVDPRVDSLRADPRFEQLLTRMNIRP